MIRDMVVWAVAMAAGGVALAESGAPATEPAAPQSVVTDPGRISQTRLAQASGGPAAGKRDAKLEPVALFYGAMPTGVSVSAGGRIFVCFPRWGDPVKYTVAEVGNGELRPFPDAQTNQFEPSDPQKFVARTHFVSVQSVVVDSKDRLWILDTGSINMQQPMENGPKLCGYDLASGKRVSVFTLGGAIRPNTYLNDVRFDYPLTRAYITDSGAGGIIVVDLQSGMASRMLDGRPSVMADAGVALRVEGEALSRSVPGKPPQPMRVNSDGIALSPDGKTLFYTPLTSRTVYAVPSELALQQNVQPVQIDRAVWKVIEKPSANDGLMMDSLGRIYSTDFEDNAIRRTGNSLEGKRSTLETLVQDERLLWPDSLWLHGGYLYITSNQLHRQPSFHGGEDMRRQPYVLFRYPVDAHAVEQR